MKVTGFQLVTSKVFSFPIGGAKLSDPYILKGADGLAPPEVDVVISDTAYQGGFYQGRRPQLREISLKIGLNPDYSKGQTVEQLRTDLYSTLTPGVNDVVRFFILDQTPIASVDCWTKKFEASIFSPTPEVLITLACKEPYFTAVEAFQLPTSSPKTQITINNYGTAPTGYNIRLTFTTSVNGFTVTDTRGDRIKLDYAFSSGDTLVINTNPGTRDITVASSGGTPQSILYSMTRDSKWQLLFSGQNTLQFSSSAFNWQQLYFLPKYWGV